MTSHRVVYLSMMGFNSAANQLINHLDKLEAIDGEWKPMQLQMEREDKSLDPVTNTKQIIPMHLNRW